jgi:hypothetical protein
MADPSLADLMQMKAPENMYFDHLYSEFLMLESNLTSPPASDAEAKVAALHDKRQAGTLDWNDVYLFELIIADTQPASTLRGKILSLRHDYLSVAGQAEYEEYMASRPKNLLDPPDPSALPDAHANYEKLLREDSKDLLKRLYLRYAVLPVREQKLKHLTLRAAFLCGGFLLILIVFTVAMLIKDGRIPSISIYVVMFAGAMGGFVSALQRIQSSPTQGDSIYNLSMLFHGTYAFFVAPLTGSIFSILLYLMFTGGVIKGSFFPSIYTPSGSTTRLSARPDDANNMNGNGNANSSKGSTNNANGGSNTNGGNGNGNGNTANAGGNSNRGAMNGNAGPNRNINSNTNGSNTNANANAGSLDNLTDNSANLNVNVANSNTANANVKAANANGNANSSGNVAAGGETQSPPPPPTPAAQDVATSSIGIRQFLTDSGPAGGEDYALLIIWSFIAGFAERFVPDALNRLVVGKHGGGQTKA